VTVLHTSADDYEEELRSLDLGKHLTTWRTDNLCLTEKELLGLASKPLALRLLPDNLQH